MIVGFTGTRQGMTSWQRGNVMHLLEKLAPHAAVHGDCVGADADFDALCKVRGIPVRVRPANIPSMRAGCDSTAVADPKPPLARNADIVAECDALIACPETSAEQVRSGTWSTVRAMRRKVGGDLYVIWPNGHVVHEGKRGPQA